MTALGIVFAGMGALFVWSGISNPPGGLWSEFGRIISGEPVKGKLSAGTTIAPPNLDPNQAAGIGPAAPNAAYAAAVAFAQSQIGKPYVYGATGPNSWDCSGLTQAAYAAGGITVPRTSEAQSAYGTAILESEAVPGDAVCFGVAAGMAHHIGIYTGNGNLIHSPSTGGHVEQIPVWHTEPMFYRRMVTVANPVNQSISPTGKIAALAGQS